MGRFEDEPKGIVLLCRTRQGKEAGGTCPIPGSGMVCPSSHLEPCGEQKRPTWALSPGAGHNVMTQVPAYFLHNR